MANATDEIVHKDVPADIAVRGLETLVREQTIFYADFAITNDTEDLSKISHEIEEIEDRVAKLYDLFGNDPEADSLIAVFEEQDEETETDDEEETAA